MTEELFVGGPLAGWRDIDQYGRHGGRVLYPIIRPVSFEVVEEMVDDYRIGTYRRQRYWHPSWRIILPMWTASPVDGEDHLAHPPWDGGEHSYVRSGMHNYWLQRPGAARWAELQTAWDCP